MVSESTDAHGEARETRAQIARTGFFREGDPGSHDPNFVSNVIEELRRVWIEGELAARGRSTLEVVTQALIVLSSDGEKNEVRLDEEVDFVAIAGEKAMVIEPFSATVR